MLKPTDPLWENMSDQELDDLHKILTKKYKKLKDPLTEDLKLHNQIVDLEDYCQHRSIPGYEFS